MAAVTLSSGLMTLLFVVGVWELVWKGIGMWKSAHHDQIWWFSCILVFNTLGILPIIYLAFFEKRAQAPSQARRRSSK